MGRRHDGPPITPTGLADGLEVGSPLRSDGRGIAAAVPMRPTNGGSPATLLASALDVSPRYSRLSRPSTRPASGGRQADEQPRDDDDDGADHVVPQEGDVGGARHPCHRGHSGNQAEEGARPGRPGKGDGQDEYPEDRAVEERSEAIDHFY